jgi:hypothetical protein
VCGPESAEAKFARAEAESACAEVTEELSEGHHHGAEAVETRPSRNENLSEATGTAGRLRRGKVGPNGEEIGGTLACFTFPFHVLGNQDCGAPSKT